MTGPDGTPDLAALQSALSCAAKACACFRMGLPRLGRDALASAAAAEVFPDGTNGAASLAAVLDAVETAGDTAAFPALIAALTGGAP